MGLFSWMHSGETVPLKLVLYLDIGKGNCRGAVVEIRKGKPHILYTIIGEGRISDKEEKDMSILAFSSLENVFDQMARIITRTSTKDRMLAAEEVYCILGAPYYLSHTALITHKSEKPFIVSPHFIDSLLKAETRTLLKAHEGTLVGTSTETLHERIIDIKINGYHINNPYGKEAKEVTVSAFRTSVDKKVIESIESVVRKFTSARVSIEPLSLASFISLRNRVEAESDFLFMTIGSEVSEVSLVRNHSLLETVSFPFGKFSLVRHVARKLNIDPQEALPRLGLYHDNKLSQQEMFALQPIIKEAQAEWLSYLEHALINLSEETAVPAKLYLLADTDLKDIFSEISSAKGFASQTLVPNGFDVILVDTALLADSVSFGLDIRFDSIIAISATFAGAAKEAVSSLYPQKQR